MIIWAAELRAIQSMAIGWSRISKKCSTTMRQYLALLARAPCQTREPLYAVRATETVQFLLTDMITADGAFAASYDADSEGEEGRFYVWSYDELEQLLPSPICASSARPMMPARRQLGGPYHPQSYRGPDRFWTCRAKSRLARCRAHPARRSPQTRIAPGFDDKVLADWNGLAISRLADASRVFGNIAWLDGRRTCLRPDHRLCSGPADRFIIPGAKASRKHHATADGYANLIAAALALHAAPTINLYLDWAEKFADALASPSLERERGGFYFASDQATRTPGSPLLGSRRCDAQCQWRDDRQSRPASAS